MVNKNMNTYRFSIENFISTDIAQLAYYIIADAKWTNRSINGSSSSVRFSVIISTNDLYVAVEARSPTWPVGSISVVAQCSIHCTAQRCISVISRLVKNSEPNRFITCRRNLIFTSNLAMFWLIDCIWINKWKQEQSYFNSKLGEIPGSKIQRYYPK